MSDDRIIELLADIRARLDIIERRLDPCQPWSVEQWSAMPLEREVGPPPLGD